MMHCLLVSQQGSQVSNQPKHTMSSTNPTQSLPVELCPLHFQTSNYLPPTPTPIFATFFISSVSTLSSSDSFLHHCPPYLRPFRNLTANVQHLFLPLIHFHLFPPSLPFHVVSTATTWKALSSSVSLVVPQPSIVRAASKGAFSFSFLSPGPQLKAHVAARVAPTAPWSCEDPFSLSMASCK